MANNMILVDDPRDFTTRPAEEFSTNYPGNPEEAPDLGAMALRYGAPIAASMIPGVGPAVLAGTAAASEFGAQQVEKGLHTPSLGEVGEAGLAAGASFVGDKVLAPVVNFLGNKVMNAGARVLNRILVPKDFYTAKEYIPARNLYDTLKQLGSAPTPGTVVDTDFANFIEGATRGALWGKKAVMDLDKKNMQLITQSTMDYIDSHARLAFDPNPFDQNGLLKELAKSRFGQIAEGVLTGKLNMARIVNAKNYEAFRQSIAGQGLEVEAGEVFKLLKQHEGNPFMQDVSGAIGQWLKPIQQEVMGLDGKPVMVDTTRITAENAYEALRELNSFFTGKKGEKWAANQIKQTLDPEFKSTLSTAPDALESYTHAQKTFSRMSENLDNKLINGLRKKFDESPSAALQVIDGSTGKKFDTLLAIKKAYQTTSEGTATGSLAAYNRNIIEPLRYHTLQQSMNPETGELVGKELVNRLDKMGREYGEEVFGGPEGLQALYNLGYASQRILEGQAMGGRSMYVKLAQGGVLASSAFRDWGDVSKGAKISAIGLFIGPAVLARHVVGNPKLTQAVIDGMTESVGSPRFNRAAAQFIMLGGKDVALSEGLRRVYTTDEAHATVNPGELPQGVDQSIQFIPADIAEREFVRQYQAAQSSPEEPLAF